MNQEEVHAYFAVKDFLNRIKAKVLKPALALLNKKIAIKLYDRYDPIEFELVSVEGAGAFGYQRDFAKNTYRSTFKGHDNTAYQRMHHLIFDIVFQDGVPIAPGEYEVKYVIKLRRDVVFRQEPGDRWKRFEKIDDKEIVGTLKYEMMQDGKVSVTGNEVAWKQDEW